MDEDSYRATLLVAWALAEQTASLPLKACLDAIDHADAVGPIVDPTLWRNRRSAMGEDKDILRALYQVQCVMQRLREAHPSGDET